MSDDDNKRTTGSRKQPNTYFSQRMMRRGVFETCFSAHVDAAVAKKTEDELFSLVEPGEAILVWFVDTTRVTGFSPDIGPAGTQLVSRFKKQGGQFMVVVITKMAVRMMAQAIALTSSMKMEIYDSRTRALEHLQTEILPQLRETSL
ncbi:MAG: hypothetical protein ABIO72_02905 [Patescibacteria group bacterium]